MNPAERVVQDFSTLVGTYVETPDEEGVDLETDFSAALANIVLGMEPEHLGGAADYLQSLRPTDEAGKRHLAFAFAFLGHCVQDKESREIGPAANRLMTKVSEQAAFGKPVALNLGERNQFASELKRFADQLTKESRKADKMARVRGVAKSGGANVSELAAKIEAQLKAAQEGVRRKLDGGREKRLKGIGEARAREVIEQEDRLLNEVTNWLKTYVENGDIEPENLEKCIEETFYVYAFQAALDSYDNYHHEVFDPVIRQLDAKEGFTGLPLRLPGYPEGEGPIDYVNLTDELRSNPTKDLEHTYEMSRAAQNELNAVARYFIFKWETFKAPTCVPEGSELRSSELVREGSALVSQLEALFSDHKARIKHWYDKKAATIELGQTYSAGTNKGYDVTGWAKIGDTFE